MTRCPTCGADNDDARATCETCGADLGQSAVAVQGSTISTLDPSLPSVPPAQTDLTGPAPPQRSGRPLLILFAGIVILALAAAYILGRAPSGTVPVVAPTSGLPTAQSARLALAAGCDPVVVLHPLDNAHVTPPETVPYGTEPPAGGPHYDGVAPTGISTEELPAELLGHNMEHGHVVIWYGSGAHGAFLNSLLPVVESHSTGVVLTPRRRLDQAGIAIAFSAWGRLSTCAAPTTPQALSQFARDFVETYGANGPEGFIAGSPRGT